MTDCPVHVVPTRNCAEGIAALMELDPSETPAAERRGDDGRGPRPPDDAGDRGRPRRDAVGHQGQEGPDDRARPRRRAARGRQATPTRPCWRRSRGWRPGFGLVSIYYGEGATLEATRERSRRRIQALVAGPRGRGGRARRPAPLPVPDLRRVSDRKRAAAPPRQPLAPAAAGRRAAARSRGDPGARRSGCRASRRSRRCGATRGGWASRRCATCCSTSRAGTTTCASSAACADLRDLDDGTVASARVTVVDIEVQQTFRRRVQVATAHLADGSGFATATWFGRRYVERRIRPGDELLLSGRIKHFHGGGRVRGARLPAGRRLEPAPRGADRAGLPADDRAHREPPARRDARGAGRAPGTQYPEYLPDGLRRGRASCRRSARRSRPRTTRSTFEARDAALRRLAFDELLALQLGMVGRRRARGRSHTEPIADRRRRRTPGSARRWRRRIGRKLGHEAALTPDQATRDRRDPRRPRAPGADAPARPGRRRLGQDGGRRLGPRGGGARRAARRRCSPRRTCWRASTSRPSRGCSRTSGSRSRCSRARCRRTRAARATEAMRDGPGAGRGRDARAAPGGRRVRRPRPGRRRRAAPVRRRAARRARGQGPSAARRTSC